MNVLVLIDCTWSRQNPIEFGALPIKKRTPIQMTMYVMFRLAFSSASFFFLIRLFLVASIDSPACMNVSAVCIFGNLAWKINLPKINISILKIKINISKIFKTWFLLVRRTVYNNLIFFIKNRFFKQYNKKKHYK